MVDDLVKNNVHVFEHRNHDLDHVGPLHVSGHASQDEYAEMIQVTKPKFFIPIYGAYRVKQRHIELAVEQGIPRANTVNAVNGEVIALTPEKLEVIGEVPSGTILVDQTGAIVSNVVVKDRVLLAEEGLVAVVLTVDKRSGNLLSSPDIISRGFIYMREQEEMMNGLRAEVRRAVQQRYKRIDIDRFKAELKDHITHYLFEQTGRSPIVIPVLNIVGGKSEKQATPGQANEPNKPVEKQKTPEEVAAEQQARFQAMRERLLNQDPRVD